MGLRDASASKKLCGWIIHTHVKRFMSRPCKNTPLSVHGGLIRRNHNSVNLHICSFLLISPPAVFPYCCSWNVVATVEFLRGDLIAALTPVTAAVDSEGELKLMPTRVITSRTAVTAKSSSADEQAIFFVCKKKHRKARSAMAALCQS